MKKTLSILLLAAISTVASAQTAITIERKDGTKFHTSLENFLEATFTEEAETAFDTDNYPVYTGLVIQYFDKNSYGTMLPLEQIAPHLWMGSVRLESRTGGNDCMTNLMDTAQENFWKPVSTEGDVTTYEKNEWVEYGYLSTGTYLFIFNDATCCMTTKRLYDEADVTEKVVEVEKLPQSDYTVAYNIGDKNVNAEFMGNGLWRAITELKKGDSFKLTRTDKEGTAAVWGAAEAGQVASAVGNITENSENAFTLQCEDGRYSIVFDEANGTYALMPTATVMLRTLTFEDKDYKGPGNVFDTALPWSGLIDDPQYGGSLLYGSNASQYQWSDEGNTGLKWDGFDKSGYLHTYAAGGYAISHYVHEPQSTPQYQLSIPFGDGSNNFCMAFNRSDSYSTKKVSPIYFADGNARVIRSIDVTNSSYAAGSLLYGDGFASAAKEGTEFFVNIKGNRADGSSAVVQYHLCKDTDILTDRWVTVDCTSLGAVTSIEIYVTGSDDISGSYGLNTPGYVAFDNIVVEY